MADTPATPAKSAAGERPRIRRPARLTTLKRRPEFLRVRSGVRWATPAFVLEGKPRSDPGAGDQARFGFTVSKQVGGAVERNRIRRRLKAAIRGILPDHVRRDFDYVIVARRPALDAQFSALVSDLVDALKRVHMRALGASGGRRRGEG
ncbi:MAG: ribonuclease P protein component [Hyphomicrobiaceae bacterium]|nr:ribonuclease P protein component [Hyphomicrobiaceae bacterium]